ncbi:MAG: DUF424 family protein [Candidatus Nanoarchaeia archaeon]
MIVNIIKSYRDIIAICDSELLGKRFEEGQFQLDIKESFYKGIEKSLEETIKIMEDFSSEDATFNIVGQKSVDAALQAGIIDQEGIKKIQDIPFAMVLM